MNWELVFFQLLNLTLLASWVILSVLTLRELRKRQLDGSTRSIWVFIVLVIPILGAGAFWYFNPGASGPN